MGSRSVVCFVFIRKFLTAEEHFRVRNHARIGASHIANRVAHGNNCALFAQID